MDELRGIAFRLQAVGLVSFDSLAGDTLESKSGALVLWCMQRNFIAVLDFVLKKERPDLANL